MDISNKRIFFLGDSITEGVGASAYEHCYVGLFEKNYPDAKIFNYGVSGTRIAKQTNPSMEPRFDYDFNMRADDMEENADLVVIFGGTNDFGHGDAPLGKYGDRKTDTFYGATYVLFEKLAVKYPTAKFLVLTPMHRGDEDIPNQHGRILNEYREGLIKTAEYFSFPVLDLFAVSGINPRVGEMQQRYMPDALHPNDAGYRLLFEKVDNYIKTLL